MLTPPTTIPGAGPSLHDFGLAMLIMVGFVLVAGWFVGPKRRRPCHKVGTVAPLRPWKGPDGKVDYQLYLRSGAWARKKRKLRRKTGYVCKWPSCRVAHDLQAHHMTYLHLGDERMDELVWLCPSHHAQVPTRPHPLLEVQREFFGVGPRRKVAA